jgi:hypothetical protein
VPHQVASPAQICNNPAVQPYMMRDFNAERQHFGTPPSNSSRSTVPPRPLVLAHSVHGWAANGIQRGLRSVMRRGAAPLP